MVRYITTACIGIMLLGILCSVPAAADIPTDIVDQYWVWSPAQAPPPPGQFTNPINRIGVAAPVWGTNYSSLTLASVLVPNPVNQVWVEVHYMAAQSQMAALLLYDDALVSHQPDSATISADGKRLTWHWTLDFQPAWERVRFGNSNFYNLVGMESVEVAAKVPEPAGMMPLLTGAVGCLLLRRRR